MSDYELKFVTLSETMLVIFIVSTCILGIAVGICLFHLGNSYNNGFQDGIKYFTAHESSSND